MTNQPPDENPVTDLEQMKADARTIRIELPRHIRTAEEARRWSESEEGRLAFDEAYRAKHGKLPQRFVPPDASL